MSLQKQTTLLGRNASGSALQEIPFDLNKIFSLHYEFQQLKEVIEFIFDALKKNADTTHGLDIKLMTKLLLIDKYDFLTCKHSKFFL
jgi:hypothetical protein